MENRQLKSNIEQLDMRIGQLNLEIEEMRSADNYESKMRTLTDLIELRGRLGQIYGDNASDVIKELDRQIEELTLKVTTYNSVNDYQAKIKELEEITKVRCQLAESKVKQSHAPALISGLFGISAVLLVLNYEKMDIVTSKAFGLATGMFRGK